MGHGLVRILRMFKVLGLLRGSAQASVRTTIKENLFRYNLGPSGTIWDHLESFGTIRDHMQSSI